MVIFTDPEPCLAPTGISLKVPQTDYSSISLCLFPIIYTEDVHLSTPCRHFYLSAQEPETFRFLLMHSAQWYAFREITADPDGIFAVFLTPSLLVLLLRSTCTVYKTSPQHIRRSPLQCGNLRRQECKKTRYRKASGLFGDPSEIRTPDPLLKRQLLCRLS